MKTLHAGMRALRPEEGMMSDFQLTGRSFIGFRRGGDGDDAFRAFDPTANIEINPQFFCASPTEVDETCRLAANAFHSYSRTSGRGRATFLRAIATKIEELRPALVPRAMLEAALPKARVHSEIGRACNQLLMFADLIEEGSWVDARIDRSDSARQPLPKPDVRSMLRPLGPAAIFCASNFPIAFSVAGGDTASALAAGCPVVVNAHYAHPGTAEIVASAIIDAARECNMPEGVFSLVFSVGTEVGQRLVQHSDISAVGFTGSRAGGLALLKLAQTRPLPIPFFAEMSSVNPVFILPHAMQQRGDDIATGMHASITVGVGQFCTNPGIVVVEESDESIGFREKLAELISSTRPSTMLTGGIASNYRRLVGARTADDQVETVATSPTETEVGACDARSALFVTDAKSFLSNPELQEEVFGPSSLVVTQSNREELLSIARALEGQLTATIHGTDDDLRDYSDLIAILETRVGRVVINGYPTGVEVCHAMVHGGPFPATSDSRSTSVGTRAIFRFARPVCFQDFPQSALADELKDENPLGIWRMVDGRMTRDATK